MCFLCSGVSARVFFLTANAAVMIFYCFNSLATQFRAALTNHNGQVFFSFFPISI